MGTFMTKQGSRLDYNYKEFTVDTADDIQEISTIGVAPGSICFVIDASEVYMLNTEKEWKLI